MPAIRPERPDDYAQISEFPAKAFGGTDEITLVERLRASEDGVSGMLEFAPAFDLFL